MKGLFIRFGLPSILLLVAAPAFAGQVTLGASGTNGGLANSPTPTLHFTSNGGGNFTLTISTPASPNTTNGVASDTFGGAVENGYYSIVQTSGSITGSFNSGTGLFDITQTPSSNIMFYYGDNAPGGNDGAFLSGLLQLVSLQQTASTKSGVFNEALVVNLTSIDPSGSLMPYFSSGNGLVQLTLHFSSTTNLMTAASGTKLTAYISTGSVVPAPEPASLVMLGTGLVAIAGLTRKLKRPASAA